MSRLDAAFAPTWAGGWAASRLIFVFAAICAHLPRLFRIDDAYACRDMLFTRPPYSLADWVVWSPASATAVWALGALGIVGVAWGGAWFRLGLLAYLLGTWGLLAEEALNVKAHDRLALWVALALFVSPAGERGLSQKWRSPAGRWLMLIVFGWLYWSTGTLKATQEPGWWDGRALQLNLVHRFHAGGPLALWLSGHRVVCRVLGWATVGFEMGSPFLLVWRRGNPWVLLVGAGFHLGILTMMNVGAFSFVALSAYPVLLHPEVGRKLWERMSGMRPHIPR